LHYVDAHGRLPNRLRIDSDMRPPTASPARTALPTAHCERDVATIRETAGLLALIHGARKIPASQGDQSDYGKVKHQS
jgi:hypothetical protein